MVLFRHAGVWSARFAAARKELDVAGVTDGSHAPARRRASLKRSAARRPGATSPRNEISWQRSRHRPLRTSCSIPNRSFRRLPGRRRRSGPASQRIPLRWVHLLPSRIQQRCWRTFSSIKFLFRKLALRRRTSDGDLLGRFNVNRIPNTKQPRLQKDLPWQPERHNVTTSG